MNFALVQNLLGVTLRKRRPFQEADGGNPAASKAVKMLLFL